MSGHKKWTELLDKILEDPEAKEAYEKAQARAATEIRGYCERGCCVEYRDPETGEYRGGWGPVGCVCQDNDQ